MMNTLPQNKIKYTIENLKNIISEGNEQLIQFQNKVFTLKNIKLKPKNKLQMDQNGKLYTINNDEREYVIEKDKYGLMPNFCPICGRIMGKKQFDSYFWNVHKRCFDCSIKLQNEMRKNGTWEAYAWNVMKDNLVHTCDLAIQFYSEAKSEANRELVINGQGQTERWDIQDVEKFNETIDKTINQIREYKEKALQYFQQELRKLNE